SGRTFSVFASTFPSALPTKLFSFEPIQPVHARSQMQGLPDSLALPLSHLSLSTCASVSARFRISFPAGRDQTAVPDRQNLEFSAFEPPNTFCRDRSDPPASFPFIHPRLAHRRWLRRFRSFPSKSSWHLALAPGPITRRETAFPPAPSPSRSSRNFA